MRVDKLEAGGFGLADANSLSGKVADLALKLIALLAQLVDQLLHAAELLGDVGTGHLARITVCADQAQLTHGGALAVIAFNNAWGLGKAFLPVLNQQAQRGAATMPAHDDVPIAVFTHADRLL